MKKIIFIIFPFLFLVGCSTYISRYYLSCEQDNSATKFVQVANSPESSELKDEIFARYKHIYEDDFIKLHMDCEPYEIGFYIINKTNNPIRIIWDSLKIYSEYLKDNSISFIHSNKTQDNIVIPDSSALDYNEKILLTKLRNEDSLSIIKPSIILAKETWMDEIQPKQNKHLLPYQLSNKDSLKTKSDKVIGKKIKLLFPIKINEEIINYKFIFTVNDFQILSKG